jgi:hypothetical protein
MFSWVICISALRIPRETSWTNLARGGAALAECLQRFLDRAIVHQFLCEDDPILQCHRSSLGCVRAASVRGITADEQPTLEPRRGEEHLAQRAIDDLVAVLQGIADLADDALERFQPLAQHLDELCPFIAGVRGLGCDQQQIHPIIAQRDVSGLGADGLVERAVVELVRSGCPGGHENAKH